MKIIYYLIIFALLSSCSVDNKNIPFEEINFSNKYISLENELNFKFIPLETNNECLIGSISNIQIQNNLIFILEGHKNENLYIFDMDGKFVSKVGTKGAGPGQYIKIIDFDIDTKNQQIILSDMYKGCLLHYDLNTYKFLRTTNTDFYYNQFCILPDNNILFFNSNGFENPNIFNVKKKYYIQETDNYAIPRRSYYKANFTTPYTLKNKGKNNFYKYNNEIYVYHHLFPYIWKYKDKDINAKYHIKLDNYIFPDINFLKENSMSSGKERDYTPQLINSNYITNYRIDESSDIISISIQKNNMPIQALYNKKKREGYLFSLKDYYKSLNLGMLMFPIGSTDEYIIGHIQMNDDIQLVKENMKLHKIITHKTTEDNPIICLYKWN